MEKNRLGAAIRHEREKKGISQEKLAELLNISRQAVSKWETGLSLPTGENLRRLEQVLGLEEGVLSVQNEPAPAATAPRKNWKGLVLGVLAAAVLGFGVGRFTAPPPAAEPLTKTIWRPVEYHDVGERVDHRERITYNDMGNMLRREVEDGGQVYIQEAEYDEAGNRTVYRSYYPDEVMNYTTEMEYDEMGNRILSRRLNWEGELEYWVEQTFDEHGEQIRYQKFNAQGEIEQSERWLHTYLEDGSHQSDYFYQSVNEAEATRIVALRDPYDNVLSITRYDVDGTVMETGTWTYQSFEVPVDFVPED